MTANPGDSPAVTNPQLTPAPGSRLEQLLDMHEAAKAAVTEAKARLAAIEAGIMTEAAAVYPGYAVIDITGTATRTPLRMRWQQGNWYVPAEELRAKHRDVWDELRMRQKGHWGLHPVTG